MGSSQPVPEVRRLCWQPSAAPGSGWIRAGRWLRAPGEGAPSIRHQPLRQLTVWLGEMLQRNSSAMLRLGRTGAGELVPAPGMGARRGGGTSASTSCPEKGVQPSRFPCFPLCCFSAFSWDSALPPASLTFSTAYFISLF